MYPNYITKDCTKAILDQMNRSLYKIYYGEEGNFNFGFFCHIKYENKKIPVIITNYQHKYFLKNNHIKATINKENKSIELGKTKCFSKLYDLSIIEIKENKNNKIYFLDLDENLYEKNSETNYNKVPIYIIHYAHNKNIYSTFGKTEDLNGSKLIYRCNSNLNLKSFPIFNLSNNKLIGISKEKSKLYRNGIFFKFIIKKFI